jgi:hypothetical protein
MIDINSILNFIFDAFFNPFDSLHPIYGLGAISLLTTLIVLPVFRYISNQEGIKRAKDRIIGHLLEVRLFNDDLRIFLLAQKNILKYNLIYLGYMLKPLMIMIIPIMIIIIQTGARYEYRPLHPGEAAIVKVILGTKGTLSEKGSKVVLTASKGLKLETPSLRVDGGREMYWRVKAEREGEFDLLFQVPDGEVKRRVVVKNKVARLSSLMLKGGIINSFFHPGEPFLPESTTIESIEVKYPPMKVSVFGWNIHWLVIFFVLTLAFGFLLMRPFNVRI